MIKNEAEVFKMTVECVSTVYNELGKDYQNKSILKALVYELEKCGFAVQKDKKILLKYKRARINTAYTVDILINNNVAVLIRKKCCQDDILKKLVHTILTLSKYKLVIVLDNDN